MIRCTEQIAILMATYNGAAYLSEQLDSILCQTFADWHLYIHDDSSDDETLEILSRYEREHQQQITILNYSPQGGACRNFFSLLDAVEAPYYMFSDQDDVWLPMKIEKTFERMNTIEQEAPGTPIVVHSDLCMVDASLQPIAPSFIRNQQIKIERIRHFEDYAATNTVTGCTMIFNQKAKQCMKMPKTKAMMHDSWICLSVVAHNGIVSFIDEPLVKYRQHGNNTLGATDISKMTMLHKLRIAHRMLKADIRHFQEMNAVRPLSIIEFIKAKIRYRR